MAMVRDPQFWHRFSVAAHQDEVSKEEKQTRPELKHSYVEPKSPSMSSIASPTTPAPFSPTLSITPLSPATAHNFSRPTSQHASQPTTPTIPRNPSRPGPSRQPSKLAKLPPAHTRPQPTKSPRKSRGFYRQRANSSLLTLGLSGRPNSRFNFWTSIEANPGNRESWLEEQRRKKSKRTYMCWGFWLMFFAMVAGIVVAILILKSRGII